MVIVGYQLLSLVNSGYCWLSVVIIGYQMLFLVIAGYQWLLMVISCYRWLSVIVVGYQWSLLVMYRLTHGFRGGMGYTRGWLIILPEGVARGRYN